jgi:hypothetical protein
MMGTLILSTAVTLNSFQGPSCSTLGARMHKWTLNQVQGDGVEV